jgi:uncharacterized damage-inducible protein DinB
VATEAWLSGPVAGVLPELQPAAHMLMQSAKELEAATSTLSPAELWARPGGAASVGFHLRHIAGSTDRLLTYAQGGSLSDSQRAALAAETMAGQSNLSELWSDARAAIERALDTLRSADRNRLFDHRSVGRAQLPSSVFGLLYHVAEHTVRHTGQVIATSKALRIKDEGL